MNTLTVTNRKSQKINLTSIDSSTYRNLVKDVIHFNSYIKDGERYILIAKKGELLNNSLNQKLSNSEFIFVDNLEHKRYLEANLLSIFKNENLMVEQKSKILYSAVTSVVKNMFEEPTIESITKTKDTIESMLDEILADDKTLNALMSVTAHDYYTYSHSVNVMIYSLSLGKAINLESTRLPKLGISALLHDIGKSQIPSEIINKNGRLSDKEFEIIKNHSQYGYEIAKESGIDDEEILSGIRHHHEKSDGSGYPDSIRYLNLKVFPKIIAIADIFDALTTKRSYKNALSGSNALSLIRSNMLHHLNKRLFDTFCSLIEC